MKDGSFTPEDYRLTTAEILHHVPGDPPSDDSQLETYVWQGLDRIPDFPKLNEFLRAWDAEQKGELHSVRIAIVGPPGMAGWSHQDHSRSLH